EFVTFESGSITLRIRNTFPVPIDFPDPIVLKNAAVDTSEVARFSFAGRTFQPGETATVSTSLVGVTMQSRLRVQSTRVRAQASTGAVTFLPNSGIEFVMSLSNTSARSAKARIPSQAVLRVRDSLFTVDDSVALQSATFTGGSFSVVLQNNIDVRVSVFLKFTEFQNKTTRAPFTINHTFDGKGSVSVPVNARDLEILTTSTGIGTRVTFSAGIETIESQEPRLVNNGDFFRVELRPQTPFAIESVTGRIKPTRLAINAGATGADFGEASEKFKGNFTFDSVRVALRLGITGGFPTDYDLRLIAMNRRTIPAKIDSLVIPPPQGSAIRRFVPGPGSMTTLVLDNSSGLNRFFSKFFPNFPDTFVVRGSVVMNPPDVFPTSQGIKSIYDTTKLYSSIDLSFPLKLAIAGGEVTDTVDIGSGEKVPKDFVTSVKSGTMYFELTNGLPIQLSLRAALIGKTTSGRRDTLLWIPTDGPRVIAAASIDQGGRVSGSKLSSFSIRLIGSEIDKFNDADVMWFKLQVETSGGGVTPVQIRGSDFVRIRASANMVYTVNK
ncbi:MAG TPA: hypothetical protein DCP63_10520, partial [Bacteroidetes bacterium]|nr:hypothetical protein [Bacteroidota bacterium]